MNWLTSQIAIGNYLDAQDEELLRREGITSILSLDGSLARYGWPRTPSNFASAPVFNQHAPFA